MTDDVEKNKNGHTVNIRLKWVGGICGLLVVAGVVGWINYVTTQVGQVDGIKQFAQGTQGWVKTIQEKQDKLHEAVHNNEVNAAVLCERLRNLSGKNDQCMRDK